MTEDDEQDGDGAEAIERRDASQSGPPAAPLTHKVTLQIGSVIALMALAWILVLLHVGLWSSTIRPAGGVLSYTFDGWERFPVSGHAFMAQYDGSEFARHRAYTSFSYPFLFTMYALVAPLHLFLGLPYDLAHNILPYIYVAALLLLLAVVTRRELAAAASHSCVERTLLIFLAVGVSVTTALPWVSLLNYNRETVHIAAAGCFCYLSALLFNGKPVRRALLIAGILLALWSPIFVPAWLISNFVFSDTPRLGRRRIVEIGGVCVLALVNMALPVWITRCLGIFGAGSTFRYRSGLDGSARYVSDIAQAVAHPVSARLWPLLLPVALAPLVAAGVQRLVWTGSGRDPLRQGAFLLLPYATVAIMLPQYTSIHPYMVDLLLIVPCGFAVPFWLLHDDVWQRLTGKRYAAALVVLAAIIMTNLLTVAQSFRR